MHKAIKIYLAGGMRSNWQDTTMAELRSRLPSVPLIFLDPRQNGTKDEAVYTAWDLTALDSSDIVFAYLEHDNPAGQGLALEIGYARAIVEKTDRRLDVVFVCEKDHPQYRYFGMARQCADSVYDTLDAGMDELERLLCMWGE